MTCYHPLMAYRGRTRSQNGKFPIVFTPKDGYYDMPIQVPCGQCAGCRLDQSKQWALRCVHEAQVHDENCFITLTYNNENLPKDGSLNKRDFQLFMKRLRKKYGEGIRYYMCGEYGERYSRPHYHACIFGFDFPDKELWKNEKGVRLYRSKSLEILWEYGYSSIGEVNFETAAYVARYVRKKLNNKLDFVYEGKQKEFALMSRRPGLGRAWYEKYKGDCYPKDFVTHKGKKLKPPRYYDYLYDIEKPEEMEVVKSNRKIYMENKPYEEKYGERLLRKEKYKIKQTECLRRNFENG